MRVRDEEADAAADEGGDRAGEGHGKPRVASREITGRRSARPSMATDAKEGYVHVLHVPPTGMALLVREPFLWVVCQGRSKIKEGWMRTPGGGHRRSKVDASSAGALRSGGAPSSARPPGAFHKPLSARGCAPAGSGAGSEGKNSSGTRRHSGEVIDRSRPLSCRCACSLLRR
eukprot:scaffold1261_cov377-Prasinococcus_capsulatus_cf.AAC.11